MVTGRCRQVLGGVMVSCPWWRAAQRERGEQAKHNVLLVVVMDSDPQFFSPANPQVREAGSVIDMVRKHLAFL